MVREAGALFGTSHYSEFHFLITCSDELGRLGLEHLSSSLNGVRSATSSTRPAAKADCQSHPA